MRSGLRRVSQSATVVVRECGSVWAGSLLCAKLAHSRVEHGESNNQMQQSASPEPALSRGEEQPPAAPGYVPVAERPAGDESLLFLRKPQTAKPVRVVPLPEGCVEAPYLPDRPKREPVYVDAHAHRLQSTSVGAGRPLVSEEGRQFFSDAANVIDSDDFSSITPERSLRRRSPRPEDVGAGFTTFSSRRSDEAEMGTSGSGGDPNAASTESTPHQHHPPEQQTAKKQSKFEKIREAIQKLEYYEGTPQYSAMLREFRETYSEAEIAGAAAEDDSDKREYSVNEIAAGLKGEPLDMRRASSKLQTRLVSGPHQFHPMSVLQQQGLGLHEGYAFHPSVELGNFKLDPALASQALKDEVAGGSLKDNSLALRYFGVTDIQRRQMRKCLSDIDTRDVNTCLHVMMTYPHTDSLFFIYCLLTTVFLFQMQKRYRMYDFYDEYLGLDLRQVRRLEKPLLLIVSFAMVLTILLQPLILSSIATTRIYRILMRRPIGP